MTDWKYEIWESRITFFSATLSFFVEVSFQFFSASVSFQNQKKRWNLFWLTLVIHGSPKGKYRLRETTNVTGERANVIFRKFMTPQSTTRIVLRESLISSLQIREFDQNYQQPNWQVKSWSSVLSLHLVRWQIWKWLNLAVN